MKKRLLVWVVVGDYGREGHDMPIGVFSSLELAEEAKAKAPKRFDDITIEQYVIDERNNDHEVI
jgi:hypothetical protein